MNIKLRFRKLFSRAAVVLVLASLISGFGQSLPASAQGVPPVSANIRGVPSQSSGWIVGRSVRNDTSPALRNITPHPVKPKEGEEEEANLNPPVPSSHRDMPDPVVQRTLSPNAMPAPILNFDGIPFPGVACNCAPPDTNGEVGATQYVQMVNEGIQVFNKTTGASVLGPVGISTLWSGFGGVCETAGSGDPVVIYDQIANRWVVTQFAGASIPTDECIAVSTTSDATGTWHRYDFHLGSNFYDYPKLSVWPDAYYMGMNVFNAAGTAFLGHQPYGFDRSAMLAGNPATFVSPGLQSTALGSMLPGDLDGSILPPAGAPNPWLSTDGATWPIYRFHADFATPANSTWTLGGNLVPAGYTELCTSTSNCVPQLGTTSRLDGLGDRPMFRLAYRRFADGHEALVGNRSVSSSSVAGIRWWEITNATSGVPSFVQQSTYQPDTTWRWMGSAAMDTEGNLALGFSASSSTINPQLRYAGRLATDPLNTLAQGEAILFAGTGSQTGSGNRWGDYSDMTIDPVDDCTFWYTNEYYSTTSSFNWRTRIGNFKFPGCSLAPDFTLSAAPAGQNVCVGSDAAYTIGVVSGGGFNSAVTLSASGNPGTAAFVPNPVTPPANGSANSALTISGAGAGSYSFNVNGVSGANNHSTPLTLMVASGPPGAPALTSPTNNAANVPVIPTLTWSAGTEASTYNVQVATDVAFTNIVASASGLTGLTWTSNVTLNTSVIYYWRVQSVNACGGGPTEGVDAFSPVFTFRTVAAPGDCGVGTSPNVLYQTGFESGAGGWTHSAATGTDTWVLSSANVHGGSQAFHADDIAAVSDQRLVSPAFILPSGQNPITFKFWNYQNMETRTGGCYDGGIIEVSSDGGSTWTQVPIANLLTDPYDGPISASFGNPLANLNAWCGNNPQPYLNSIVDISAYAGQTVQFRLRLGTDSSVSRPGWDIDDVVVQSCQLPLAVTLASFTAVERAGHVSVNWETVSELNNGGFNLYRSTTPDAVGNLLTYVPSQGPGSAQGYVYNYDDADVRAGQTYWYWLEDIDFSGATTQHGPVSVTVGAADSDALR
ncbi:MAG: hypothetical protein H6647_12395 [Anaerolineales bacterium]|nr:hypothetical protein [Anaerolineales bacterium]